jgi:hypothetical protein
MLHAIYRGGVQGYTDGQTPVIYLCSSTEAVDAANLRWVFTEGHADMGYTDFFDDLKDLTRIDWPLMKEKYWRDTDEDPDRSRRRQAEFLVHNFFPWNLVSNVAVYDGTVETAVRGILMRQLPQIAIQQGWYY